MNNQIDIINLKNRLAKLFEFIDIENKRIECKNLESETHNDSFWQDQKKAKGTLKKLDEIKKWIDEFDEISTNIEEIKILLELNATDEEILSLYEETKSKVEQLEFKKMLGQEEDNMTAIMNINPGAGGTESQDWAEMLQRMYVRWAESQKNSKVFLLQETKGDEAGIKSCIIKISKEYAYGWVKKESGIHRLVRISPFDSNKRRHTSFASVWVYPEVDEKIEIEINDNDLRIDTYRASGAGGQHVNKTDSAVRITHIPSNIVVQCQTDRSQHKNKSNAMNMLRSRLFELELQKRKERENKANKEKKDIGWGNQIRSYVLHPYKLIKDLRSGYETSNVNEILDGKIDNFLENSLTL